MTASSHAAAPLGVAQDLSPAVAAPAWPPPGFVHVDLDGLWTLAGAYGFPEGDAFAQDVVFERGLARLTALFERRGLRATFFLIGRDMESPAKALAVRDAIAAGRHEAACHAATHRMDLERLADAELEREIDGAAATIERAVGRRPLGFRSPGYGVGPRALAACARAGLRYDGSCLPTPWAPVLRFLAGRLRRRVARAIGPDAARPVAGEELQYGGLAANPGDPWAPGWWRGADGGGTPILRLPLAVSPVLRLPLQASLGMLLGLRRWEAAMRGTARRGWPVTWLLHGMDAVGREDLEGRLPPVLLAQRGFATPLAAKLDFLERGLDVFQSIVRPCLTEEWLGAREKTN
jgi:peptidoglycan/xylan/chitin deacetylase (PgdA/CDA1 family)